MIILLSSLHLCSAKNIFYCNISIDEDPAMSVIEYGRLILDGLIFGGLRYKYKKLQLRIFKVSWISTIVNLDCFMPVTHILRME
jgi:dolichyl-phosphate-mannose--protein O-mannosyl transferase